MSKCSDDRNIHDKSYDLFLGACFGSVIGIQVGSNEGTELGFWYGKDNGKTFEAIDILSLGLCEVTELGCSVGDTYGKFEFLFLGASLGYIDGLEVGGNEDTELFITSGRIIGKRLGTYDDIFLGLL